MSDLTAIAYPDERAVERARDNAQPEKVLARIRELEQVIQTSLSSEVEAQLDAALASAEREAE